jgi:hypothetical protein
MIVPSTFRKTAKGGNSVAIHDGEQIVLYSGRNSRLYLERATETLALPIPDFSSAKRRVIAPKKQLDAPSL